jgi:chaperonin GroES
MKFTPLQDFVLIDPTPIETETKSGLVLQLSQTNQTPQYGTIVAHGPGRRTVDGQRVLIDIKIGDVVYWNKFAGSVIKIDSKEYLLIRETDLVGVITK